MIQAAKNAQAYDFVMNLPDGFDTMLDQGGTNVSGGQKQRLSMACAIFSERGILILDEPTSGLDGKNMRLIAESELKQCRYGVRTWTK